MVTCVTVNGWQKVVSYELVQIINNGYEVSTIYIHKNQQVMELGVFLDAFGIIWLISSKRIN